MDGTVNWANREEGRVVRTGTSEPGLSTWAGAGAGAAGAAAAFAGAAVVFAASFAGEAEALAGVFAGTAEDFAAAFAGAAAALAGAFAAAFAGAAAGLAGAFAAALGAAGEFLAAAGGLLAAFPLDLLVSAFTSWSPRDTGRPWRKRGQGRVASLPGSGTCSMLYVKHIGAPSAGSYTLDEAHGQEPIRATRAYTGPMPIQRPVKCRGWRSAAVRRWWVAGISAAIHTPCIPLPQYPCPAPTRH